MGENRGGGVTGKGFPTAVHPPGGVLMGGSARGRSRIAGDGQNMLFPTITTSGDRLIDNGRFRSARGAPCPKGMGRGNVPQPQLSAVEG